MLLKSQGTESASTRGSQTSGGEMCNLASPAQSGSVTSPLEGFNHRPSSLFPIIKSPEGKQKQSRLALLREIRDFCMSVWQMLTRSSRSQGFPTNEPQSCSPLVQAGKPPGTKTYFSFPSAEPFHVAGLTLIERLFPVHLNRQEKGISVEVQNDLMPVSFFPPAYFGGEDGILGCATQTYLTYKTDGFLGFPSWFSTQGKNN